MIILASFFAYKSVQMFLRLSIYIVLGIVVLIVRWHNKKKTRKRMDKQTEYMMKHTRKDKDGKYPWEI
ncbi:MULTISPECIES: hypothetical protein [Lactobacillaceae]|uniref:hypothetical protein n=1 Tax=Lactobacillaceae TaxID=33958 RepID=UPI0014566DA2|nr:hypothetical protein [Lactobacillus sp. HBUAS51381]NLR09345.1 hypothetical protein [Lactobacillus sp. HBUAS51381]